MDFTFTVYRNLSKQQVISYRARCLILLETTSTTINVIYLIRNATRHVKSSNLYNNTVKK